MPESDAHGDVAAVARAAAAAAAGRVAAGGGRVHGRGLHRGQPPPRGRRRRQERNQLGISFCAIRCTYYLTAPSGSEFDMTVLACFANIFVV